MDSSSEDDDLVIMWLLLRRRRRRRQRARRRWWVHPLNQFRVNQGAYDNLVAELRQDEERFFNCHRMSTTQFDWLLGEVRPLISKKFCVRVPLPEGLRLSLTLRFVASGDSMVSLAYLYCVGRSTVTGVIKETTEALWTVLQPLVLKFPSAEDFAKIGQDFEDLWNFPHCIGALDGKHVVCQCPDNTGSEHHNYKGTFSSVLMALCDAHYRFTFVSVGSSGRDSDGGIFQKTPIYARLENNRLPLPHARSPVGSAVIVPPVIVGDAAFPLKKYLMRPYPGDKLPPEQEICNYRLSRARRVIENAFGILASRMRIFRKPIIADIETVNSIVKCAVVLHNWLRDQELNIPAGQRRYVPIDLVDRIDRNGNVEDGLWRQEGPGILFTWSKSGLLDLGGNVARNSTNEAKNVRWIFTEYFMGEGHVPWQWNKLPDHVSAPLRRRAETLAQQAQRRPPPPRP